MKASLTGRGVLLLLSIALGCGSPTDESHSAAPVVERVEPQGKVFLLALDGADWEIIDRLAARGRLPNLARLRREGAAGVLRSERPLLSPIVWTTMATGRAPLDHGILGFLTVRRGLTEPVRSDERRVPAFWNVLGEFGLSVGVIGWYASWPAEPVEGFLVSDRVGYHQVRGSAGRARSGLTHPDALEAEITTAWQQIEEKLGPAAAARFFSEVEGAELSVPIEPDRLDTFVGVLRTTELYRALTPRLAERFDPDLTAVYLEGTDAVGHLFAEFASPALPGTDPRAAKHLGEVFDRFYEYTDTIVGELVARLDPGETTLMIVSDHGFKSGAARPRTPTRSAHGDQAPLWHRPEGILLMWGRGVREGVELPEASLYDVLPTAFRALGVPLARSLSGQPVEAALTAELLSRPARYVDGYGDSGRRREDDSGAELPADEVLAKLRALGYVGSDAAGGDEDAADASLRSGQSAIPLNRYNLGLVLLREGRETEALELFRELQRTEPRRALGFLGEGIVGVRQRRHAEAIPVLERAVELAGGLPAVHSALGEAYLGAGRTDASMRAFRRALELDAADGRTALLLGELELAGGAFDRAAPLFDTARAHSDEPIDRAAACVGLAVLAEERGELERAAERYDEALQYRPDFPRALERYGNLELYRQRFDRGVALMERLVTATGGDDARVLTLYGRALILAGREREAREPLQRALRQDAGASEAREMLRALGEEPS